MNLSDLLVEYFELLGTEYVFGVPGSPLGPLFDALVRSERRGGPRTVLTRHEAGAAFIADGYARESGRIGVCCSTTGPGATNLITGVAAAYAEQVPLLVITSQTRVSHFSFGCFQDSSRDGIDIMTMFAGCTRYNSLVSHPNQFEQKLAAALTAALSTPRGPAHLSIPIDIFAAPWNGSLSFPGLAELLGAPKTALDSTALASLTDQVTAISQGNGKIVLLAGHHAIGSGTELSRFADLTGAELITTPRGKSAINPYHPSYRGVFGCAGHASARRALTNPAPDLILAVGSNLGEWSTSSWDTVLMNDRLIHIHSDLAAFRRSPMARLHVTGDINAIFSSLNRELSARGQSFRSTVTGQPAADRYLPHRIEVADPACCAPAQGPVLLKAPQVYRTLLENLPPETRYFIDNSNSVPWSIHYLFTRQPERYHLSIEFATMAWAVGAAIGGAFAERSAPSVCIAGDGCYLMSGQEITVAVEQKLPVIFIVLNDRAYGLIKHGHRRSGKETVDFAIPPVDFAMMARSTGAEALTIRTADELCTLDWHNLATRPGPTLLDIHVDPEAQPPLAMA